MPRGPAHDCHRRRLWPARLRARALRSSCLLAAMPVMLPGWPGSGAAWADAAIEPVAAGAARYTPVSGVAGNLSSVGSDTMANLMALWSERFQRIYPGVNLQMQAAGSSTAPPALTQGTADIGPMSRPMTASERLAFERHHGYPPLELVVAVDAIALYVNEYNPLEGISLAQVDAMFSRSRRCGAPAAAPQPCTTGRSWACQGSGSGARSHCTGAAPRRAPMATSGSGCCAAETSAAA